MERDTSTKSTAMGVVPFSMSTGLKKSLQDYSKGSVNFVEMVGGVFYVSLEVVSWSLNGVLSYSNDVRAEECGPE